MFAQHINTLRADAIGYKQLNGAAKQSSATNQDGKLEKLTPNESLHGHVFQLRIILAASLFAQLTLQHELPQPDLQHWEEGLRFNKSLEVKPQPLHRISKRSAEKQREDEDLDEAECTVFRPLFRNSRKQKNERARRSPPPHVRKEAFSKYSRKQVEDKEPWRKRRSTEEKPPQRHDEVLEEAEGRVIRPLFRRKHRARRSTPQEESLAVEESSPVFIPRFRNSRKNKEDRQPRPRFSRDLKPEAQEVMDAEESRFRNKQRSKNEEEVRSKRSTENNKESSMLEDESKLKSSGNEDVSPEETRNPRRYDKDQQQTPRFRRNLKPEAQEVMDAAESSPVFIPRFKNKQRSKNEEYEEEVRSKRSTEHKNPESVSKGSENEELSVEESSLVFMPRFRNVQRSNNHESEDHYGSEETARSKRSFEDKASSSSSKSQEPRVKSRFKRSTGNEVNNDKVEDLSVEESSPVFIPRFRNKQRLKNENKEEEIRSKRSANEDMSVEESSLVFMPRFRSSRRFNNEDSEEDYDSQDSDETEFEERSKRSTGDEMQGKLEDMSAEESSPVFMPRFKNSRRSKNEESQEGELRSKRSTQTKDAEEEESLEGAECGTIFRPLFRHHEIRPKRFAPPPVAEEEEGMDAEESSPVFPAFFRSKRRFGTRTRTRRDLGSDVVKSPMGTILTTSYVKEENLDGTKID